MQLEVFGCGIKILRETPCFSAHHQDPQELQLTVSRNMGSDDWNFDALMVILGELQA